MVGFWHRKASKFGEISPIWANGQADKLMYYFPRCKGDLGRDSLSRTKSSKELNSR